MGKSIYILLFFASFLIASCSKIEAPKKVNPSTDVSFPEKSASITTDHSTPIMGITDTENDEDYDSDSVKGITDTENDEEHDREDGTF